MKWLIALFVVAVAYADPDTESDPEADPYVLYNGGGVYSGYPYTSVATPLAGYPYGGVSTYNHGLNNFYSGYTGYTGYPGYSSTYSFLGRKKRDAEPYYGYYSRGYPSFYSGRRYGGYSGYSYPYSYRSRGYSRGYGGYYY